MKSIKAIAMPSLAALSVGAFLFISFGSAAPSSSREGLDLETITDIKFAEATVLKSKAASPMLHVVVYGLAPKEKYSQIQLIPHAASKQRESPKNLQLSVVGIGSKQVENPVPTPFAVHTVYEDLPQSVEQVTIDWHTKVIKREDFREMDLE